MIIAPCPFDLSEARVINPNALDKNLFATCKKESLFAKMRIFFKSFFSRANNYKKYFITFLV